MSENKNMIKKIIFNLLNSKKDNELLVKYKNIEF